MPRSVPWPLLLAFVACGEPNATLVVQLNALPEYTNTQSITVAGTVTRTPAEETITVVVVAGGTTTVRDSLGSPGAFSIQVQLAANTENQLAVTASDASGNVSAPVIVVIHHDNVGPTIAQMTPPSLSENASLDTPIEVVFSERVVGQPGAQITMRRNSEIVIGTPTVSADSTRISFAPASLLEPNSVYQLELQGFTDNTGNPVSTNTCFVTASTGTVVQTDLDGTDTGWLRGDPPASLIPPDLQQIRWARADSMLYGVVRFGRPRVFAYEGDSSAIVLLEIDADQDGNTGYTSAKDTIFTPFPELDSGLGIEYWIGLEPLEELGDSAYVGIMTGQFEFTVLDTFRPGVCGPFYGFNTTALLNSTGDDGRFDYTAIAFAIAVDGDLIDVMPEAGANTVDISGFASTSATAYATIRPAHAPLRVRILERLLSVTNPVRKER